MQNTLSGYAYDSHLSYLDHLRIADSARRAGEVAGEAADRGARRVEAGIAAAATQVEGRIAAVATQITDAVNEVSSEVRAAREVMEWGFSATINELAGMNATLQELLQCARTPSQTWAYEQFEIARENFRKGNYEDCLKRLDYGIGGYQSNLGYPEGWQLHQLKGDIYLQCPKRELIDLPKAEECFLAAAKYADASNERAMALTAAAVAAYNQGSMELAENYAQHACKSDRDLAEAHFQLGRIRLNRRNYSEAWQAALQAMTLDHRYAARLPLDSEFQRNIAAINPAWKQYEKNLKSPLEATAQSAAVTMRKLAKSREETNLKKNSPHAFKLLDLAGNRLAEAMARFQKMTELVNTLSPEAEKSLKLLTDGLRGNSVFALLEAEPHAQRAKDLATGALAASREAELTTKKVEELFQRLPRKPNVFLPEAVIGLVGLFGSVGFIVGVVNIVRWAFGAHIQGSIGEMTIGTLIFRFFTGHSG